MEISEPRMPIKSCSVLRQSGWANAWVSFPRLKSFTKERTLSCTHFACCNWVGIIILSTALLMLSYGKWCFCGSLCSIQIYFNFFPIPICAFVCSCFSILCCTHLFSSSHEYINILSIFINGAERDDRGWDSWMASLSWWTWV